MIKIKGMTDEDLLQYKTPSMFIIFPYCTFKCGKSICQNSTIAMAPCIDVDINKLVNRYIDNSITHAICCGGLEPFDSFDDLYNLISAFRLKTNDDIVIYSGYNKNEIIDKINKLKTFINIIIKFGRYIPNQQNHFDSVLGINLASDNQYAEKIS